jgi:hypothetical protein
MKLDKLVVEFGKLETEFQASDLDASLKKCIETGQKRLESAQDWFIDCAGTMENAIHEAASHDLDKEERRT